MKKELFTGHSRPESELDRRERLLDSVRTKKQAKIENDPLVTALSRMVAMEFPSRGYQYQWTL